MLGNFCELCKFFVVAPFLQEFMGKLFVNFLRTFCELFANFLRTFLRTFCELFADFLRVDSLPNKFPALTSHVRR